MPPQTPLSLWLRPLGVTRRSRPAALLILLGKIWAHGLGHYTRPPQGLGRSFDFRLTPSTFRFRTLHFVLAQEWRYAPRPGTEGDFAHTIGFADARDIFAGRWP